MNFEICDDDLPEGWKVTHLILLDPEWQVNLKSNEHVVVATGNTPTQAFLCALDKIQAEDYCGAGLFRFVKNLVERPLVDPRNLLQSLGLAKPVNIKRRKGL